MSLLKKNEILEATIYYQDRGIKKQPDNYKFICTSNFTHPQFKGMWEDVKWHKRITTRIKAGK